MWYEGNISDAVGHAKKTNACLLIFVQDQSESTKRLAAFFESDVIKNLLKTPKFVCLRFGNDTLAYVNFASTYKIVPVPSVFFLGLNGQPLEIGTELMTTVEELEAKILKVLNVLETQPAPSTATPTTTSDAGTANNGAATSSSLCEGGACALPPAKPKLSSSPNTSAATKEVGQTKAASDIRSKEEEALREAKEREQHLREMREKIRHDKKTEQAARDRVLAQIAADRREQADIDNIPMQVNFDIPFNLPTMAEAANTSNIVRLQFRMGDGNNTTQNFEKTSTLSEVREYVRGELLANSKSISNFILVTPFPKRDLGTELDADTLFDLGLYPSAVILVVKIESEQNSTIIRRQFANLWSISNTIFMMFLSPLRGIVNYLGSYMGQRGNTNNATHDVGQAKKDDDAGPNAAFLAARRRNAANAAADKFTSSTLNDLGADRRRWAGSANVHRISDQRRDDDNEDNATWNGNSTQQQ